MVEKIITIIDSLLKALREENNTLVSNEIARKK
jgi:hypothetical protein